MLPSKSDKVFMSILMLGIGSIVYSQSDSTSEKTPGNSFQNYFENKKISIQYSYNDSTQIHDYSNNWDFDGDGETDGLYFIGTGGAHLYFYLRIVLSSDKKIRDFTFLELDFPCVESIDQLKNANFFPPPSLPQFVVNNFYRYIPGVNLNDKIYLHLDHFPVTMPSKWKKRGVNSTYLLLQYEKGDITIKNFIR